MMSTTQRCHFICCTVTSVDLESGEDDEWFVAIRTFIRYVLSFSDRGSWSRRKNKLLSAKHYLCRKTCILSTSTRMISSTPIPILDVSFGEVLDFALSQVRVQKTAKNVPPISWKRSEMHFRKKKSQKCASGLFVSREHTLKDRLEHPYTTGKPAIEEHLRRKSYVTADTTKRGIFASSRFRHSFRQKSVMIIPSEPRRRERKNGGFKWS